jgi:molybdopterin-containing oxidoreductase family iron-sulfur binding subunit
MRKPANNPGISQGITRREFLTGAAGAAGAFALISVPLNRLLNPPKPERVPMEMDSQTPRSWCMVIDLARCEGCSTIENSPPQCTIACLSGHFAPKGQEWIQVYTQDYPGGGTFFQPTPCFQCENAPCVNVCPVAATYHDPSGVVLIDHHRCIGCRFCMAACPYQRRFFNWGTPELPPEAAFVKYSPLYPVPAIKGTVIKCMFCLHFLRMGKLPYCVSGCPMKALYMGDLNEDIASNGAEVVKLSTFLNEHEAYRYKEYLGTRPRVYYLPGYGQVFGRKPDDPRKLLPVVWPWGGEGYQRQVGVWPWGSTPK